MTQAPQAAVSSATRVADTPRAGSKPAWTGDEPNEPDEPVSGGWAGKFALLKNTRSTKQILFKHPEIRFIWFIWFIKWSGMVGKQAVFMSNLILIDEPMYLNEVNRAYAFFMPWLKKGEAQGLPLQAVFGLETT